MSNFSSPVQFYWISLFYSKYFAQDCRSLRGELNFSNQLNMSKQREMYTFFFTDDQFYLHRNILECISLKQFIICSIQNVGCQPPTEILENMKKGLGGYFDLISSTSNRMHSVASKKNRNNHQRCSVRKGVLRCRKIHRETPVPESHGKPLGDYFWKNLLTMPRQVSQMGNEWRVSRVACARMKQYNGILLEQWKSFSGEKLFQRKVFYDQLLKQ